MRFLILSQYYPPEVGAAQVRLHNFAKVLVKLGHEVSVQTALPNYPAGRIFAGYRGKSYAREVIDGVAVERSWIYPVSTAGMRRMLAYGSFQLGSFWPLLKKIRTWKPDYLFVESPPLFLGLTAMALQRLTGVPFIFNVADLWPDWAVEMGVIEKDSVYYKLAHRLEHDTYRASAYVNIVVNNMKPALLDKGVPEDKILFLPNGVDLELFSPDNRPLQSKVAREVQRRYGDKRIVLYAGTHGKYHGLEVAIDAAAQLQRRQDILFLFVGDGAEKAHLIDYAGQHQVQNVAFYDPVPPEVVAELLQLSRIALSVIQIPTRAAKIFPAMASAKPIVYAGIGEGAELLEEAGAALVVAPRDAQGVAKAVEALLDDPSLAAALGCRGRRYVEDHLSWQALVDKWLEQLKRESPI
jgi:glycosyltransferase involved in cell wall biosynthesis